MANSLNISCKKATFLISKKQEGKLALGERLQLTMHLFICDVCKLFNIQTNHILHKLKHQQKDAHSLSQESKKAIAIKVEDAINNG